MNNRKNFISALVFQAAAITQGLIIPRLIIATFGSDVNGLISSLTQFLSFISLLEGGLGAVVLAELYRPIEESDLKKIKTIIYTCQKLFRRLALIYIAYTFIIAIIYPVFISNTFSIEYAGSLTLILSITTLGQYLFAISNKLLLQATQKIYVVNYVSAGAMLLNVGVSIVLIIIYPQIHLIKICSGAVFLIQPFLFKMFLDKEYLFNDDVSDESYVFTNRWSGFSQNLAYFININTDIVVITLFMSLTDVSIYAIYMLAINALRQIISNAAISYQSALGKYLVTDDQEQLYDKFRKFELVFWGISVVFLMTCMQLINSFVSIYTSGVNDANYYQPMFALIMTLSTMMYCIREPYRILIFAAGKFKETNFGSIMEAVLNIVLSIILVHLLGLIGIAIGTFVAITYRFIYFLYYIKKEIFHNRGFGDYIKLSIELAIICCINICFYYSNSLDTTSIISFCIVGMIVFLIECVLVLFVYYSVELSIKVKARYGHDDCNGSGILAPNKRRQK